MNPKRSLEGPGTVNFSANVVFKILSGFKV